MTTRPTYRGQRAWAWRNLMVAAINAGLRQGVFSLTPQNSDPDRDSGEVYEFEFTGTLPAMGYARDVGWDEISIHAVLCPTQDGRKWIRGSNPEFLGGDVSAEGWLERRTGRYLQSSKRLFRCRSKLLAAVAGAKIEPIGFADRGLLIL